MENFFDEKDTVTEIVLAILVKRGEGNSVHKNRLSHGLAMNFGGAKTYTFDSGERLTIDHGEIIYLPKGSNYTVSILQPCETETYCINYQIADENKKATPFSVRIKHVEEVLKGYQRAESAWRRKKEGANLLCKGELYKIIYEVSREKNTPYLPERKAEIIQPAMEYIHKNYTEELISVKNLSELCGISYEYFRRLFEKFYGVSPIKYINDLKIKRAKELLLSGLYSVSDAAFASGFSDLSHFSRFFKANEGMWPSEYALQTKS